MRYAWTARWVASDGRRSMVPREREKLSLGSSLLSWRLEARGVLVLSDSLESLLLSFHSIEFQSLLPVSYRSWYGEPELISSSFTSPYHRRGRNTKMQDKSGAPERAHVVYYLCRNGKVEPPHMIDVAHSAQGLRLRDVKHRLTALRGSRMPVMYAWSFKRIYKNASIWQDISSDDFILPISTGEYVLKGSEIVEGKSSKSFSGTKPPAESLQRKFWGAESWLPTSLEGKPRTEPPLYITYRKDYEQAKLSSAKAEDLGDTEPSSGAWDRHSSSGLRHQVVQSGGEEVKVYAIKASAVADHGCDVATQTDEIRRRRQGCPEPARDSAQPSTAAAAAAPPCIKSPPAQETFVPGSPLSTKKPGKFRRVSSQDKDGDINARGTKNASASWVLFHVLSYCGGLDTKAQQGGAASLVSKEYRDWKDCPEATSSSDTSRDTRQSRSSDSLPSFDASDEAGSHKISAFVDVKEMVLTTRKTSPSRSSISGGKNFSFLSRQYGRLSKSDTYSCRNVKYDIDNGQQLSAGASDHRQEAFKFELSCYRAE